MDTGAPSSQTRAIIAAVLKPADDQKASIERLLASETMKRAPRVRTVLKFILKCSSEGNAGEINEQRIGRVVFGRPEGYNSADDNIVRVTVHNLRDRLEEFYRTEGRDEPWILEIPKGKYAPMIRRREAVLDRIEATTQIPVARVRHRHSAIGLRWLGWTTSLLFGSALLVYALGNTIFPHKATRPPDASGLIQTLFLHREERMSVVLTDSDLQAYRLIFEKTVTLEDYLTGRYLQPPSDQSDVRLQRTWEYIRRNDDTTTASALVAARLQDAIAPRILNIKHPHAFRIWDFQNNNVILLGGPWINPWGQLFKDRLNFRVVTPPSKAAGSEILNVKPLAGEPKMFVPHKEGAFTVSFVRIALLPNLSDTGKVVLMGANTAESLIAGGAFLANQSDLQKLLQCFHVHSINKLPAFEVVLEVRGVERTPHTTRIVAYRMVGPRP